MDTKNLNPEKNHYSVAPVESFVIIGRIAALKGRIERGNAINLLAWLMIATNATTDEIRAELKAAKQPSAQAPVPIEAPSNVVAIPQSVQQAVAPFIGSIDSEEAEALQSAQKP